MLTLRRIFLALSLAIVFGCADTNPPVDANDLPVDHLPPQLTPLSYNIELYLQQRKDTFTGHVEIDVEVLQPIDRLWLHGAMLKVGTVQVVGSTIATGEWRQHTPEGLSSIVFDRKIPVGRSKIILDYSAPYSPRLKGLIRTQDHQTYALSMSDGGARYVLPGFDEPRYRAPVSLSVDMPASLDALASTPVMNRTELENQRRVVRFVQSPTLALDAIGLVVGKLDTPQQLNTDHTVISGYGADPTPWLAGLSALELRAEYPYPFQKLDIIRLEHFPDTINAAGLMINPETTPQLQAERLAHHWLDFSAHHRTWQAQCVARGVAKWAGLDAYRNAKLVDQSLLNDVWLKAQVLDRYPLGNMCWDVPSDKVMPLAEVEDHTLVAAVLLSLEDKQGEDVLAEQVWRDWLDHRHAVRGVQDLMPSLYQGVYTVLQNGRLLTAPCTSNCRYSDAPKAIEFSLDKALANPKAVPRDQWYQWLQHPDVESLLEDISTQSAAITSVEALEQFGEAWLVAMGEAMGKDFERWSALLRQRSAQAETSDERLAALFALSQSQDSRVVSWIQQLLINRALQPDDSDALFANLMVSPQADVQLNWFSTNRDKIMRKLAPAQRVRWLDALGALCGSHAAEIVRDAMTPVAPLIYRGDARLQRALSRIESCKVN